MKQQRKFEVLLLLRPNRDFEKSGLLPPACKAREQRHFEPETLLHSSAAHPEDIDAVRRIAQKHRLTIRRINRHGRTIVLSGSLRALSGALREIRKELPSLIGVFGLKNEPVAKRPGRKRFPPGESLDPPPVNEHTRPPKAFRRLYEFPSGATGKGQSIGVLEFGGGFSRAKLRSYLKRLGVEMPRIIVREISPGKNRPLDQPGRLTSDAEVYLDLEVLASIAPDATLVVYFAENSSRGWIEALHAAIFDRKRRISVLSISWGQAELWWDAQTIAAIEHLLQMAALLGITVCCSSGDRGVFEDNDHAYSVPYPASSPHVLACGGTRLQVLSGRHSRETVWNDSRTSGLTSGGGVSRRFELPKFQGDHAVPKRHGGSSPGRGIPDVAANASSETGYLIWADDTAMSLGGTSATAPLWAGLIACLNEALGRRIGYITPLLYARKQNHGLQNHGLRNILEGNNRMKGGAGYDARKTWDPCTGLGTPHGVKLLKWLKRTFDLRS